MVGGLKCRAPECAKTFGSDLTAWTAQRARAARWHVWSGYTLADRWEEMVLCPIHARGGGTTGSPEQPQDQVEQPPLFPL